MKQLKVIVLGGGQRGQIYTNVMATLPEQFSVVGVAEPGEANREYIRQKHNIPAENCVTSWEQLLNRPRFADVAIISTQDKMHYAPAMKALELGYDLLLEKPVAPTAQECMDIWQQAQRYGRKVMVCHVLRYTSFYSKVKELLASGVIGDVMNITHTEGVGNLHQSHSFVRGNWGNEGRSACMLLAKSCHDLDLLQWLMNDDCDHVHSFGSLRYFRSENAPEGAPERCIQGCPHADTCYYNAVKLYLEDQKNLWFRGAATGMVEPSDEDVRHALENTQYGKCVYKCDNDVVDHQVVNLEFAKGGTVSFTMSAFNKGGRKSNIMGTRGEMFLDFEGDEIKIFHFDTRQFEIIHTRTGAVSGHGGGDDGIVRALYDYLTGVKTADEVSEIGISCRNHLLVFAAEQARHEKSVVDTKTFQQSFVR
ncbi:MAG: Gfo/Idh/MocA family oxidoreductase [Oscillospiraceae bacterium]|nr:Gfo/Idh/MocA family oxidoreductase [Oscillospiraceae bacterium]